MSSTKKSNNKPRRSLVRIRIPLALTNTKNTKRKQLNVGISSIGGIKTTSSRIATIWKEKYLS